MKLSFRTGPTRRSLQPDMTPMAGIGFLLVTFFMLVTTAAKPTLMELTMPVKPKPTDELVSRCCGNALTVLVGANNRVFYYWGMSPAFTNDPLHETTLGSEGLRQVLLAFRKESCPFVLIKTSDEASYRGMVDVLDEMRITDTRRYGLVDMTATDKQLLAQVR
ncbi:ExbD/TolR family protein [Hymenobacter metallilatus]|uniref:ExbD/TolR family protein n=1 Tax=Hymenobacter metallilatus TaxID=2493666 RepID=UPI00163B4BA6|nr:biopolymer transporter ExbD [Hymenobacter metallilatus]